MQNVILESPSDQNEMNDEGISGEQISQLPLLYQSLDQKLVAGQVLTPKNSIVFNAL